LRFVATQGIKETEALMAVENPTIAWTHDLDAALRDADARKKHVLVDFSAAPM
jgi:hypothetical protein